MTASKLKRFHGVVIPLVTPFTAAGEVDEPAVGRLLDHLIAGGVAGVLLLGTTGEDASISPADRARLVAAAARHARGRLTLYAGISANCLAQSVEAAEAYRAAGADALVARLPTYYALSPEEQHDYFRLLLDRVPGPLLLYNIPITTHMSIPLDVVEALAADPKVAGIKDSERDFDRFKDLLARLGGRPGFSIFCGAGAFFAQTMLAGADGFVPTAGNLVPALCQQLYAHARGGDQSAAEACQGQLQALAALYGRDRLLGQTYGRIKAMLGVWDLCTAEVLPPLTTPSLPEQADLRSSFQAWLAGNALDGLPPAPQLPASSVQPPASSL